MILNELLDLPIEKLEAMTDKEIEERLMPLFQVTRPEYVVKSPAQQSKIVKIDSEQQRKFDMLKSLGIDVDHLKNRRKK